jgi:hypothetical protein
VIIVSLDKALITSYFIDPVKIECTQDGQTLFYGGEQLGLITRKNKWLINEGIAKIQSKHPFYIF